MKPLYMWKKDCYSIVSKSYIVVWTFVEGIIPIPGDTEG